MSPEPPGPTRAEREEAARLLPVPVERDLPGRRHLILKDHLVREIRCGAAAAGPRTRRRRRLAFAAVPLAAGAMAVALAAGGLPDLRPTAGPGPAVASGPSARGTRATPAAVLLNRIAAVAATKPAPAVRDDQYVYIASRSAHSSLELGRSAGEHVMRPGEPHLRQVWLPVDGARPGLLRENGRDTELGPRREDAVAGGGGGRAAARPEPGRPVTASPPGGAAPSLDNPTYRYLESLPTDPDALLEKIYAETRGAGSGPDQQAFVTIGDLLREQLAPPKVSAALYEAAARIPGVTVLGDSADAAGRHGIAVARVHADERTEWIFDKRTLEFLGERSVMVEDTPWAEAGQVTAVTAVLSRGVTDKPGQTPAGAS